eukprot:SM003209S11908  [mRNA]  locus=s3209:693:1084:- [translate_table: standard]
MLKRMRWFSRAWASLTLVSSFLPDASTCLRTGMSTSGRSSAVRRR